MRGKNDPAFVIQLATGAETLVGELGSGTMVTLREGRVAEIERGKCGPGASSDRSATLPLSTLLQQFDGLGRIVHVEKSQGEVGSRPHNAPLVVKRAIKTQALPVLLHGFLVVAYLFGHKAQAIE